MIMTNCINCGAILTSYKCEYCGTEYEDRKPTNLANVMLSYGITTEQAMRIFYNNPEQVMKDAKEKIKEYRTIKYYDGTEERVEI